VWLVKPATAPAPLASLVASLEAVVAAVAAAAAAMPQMDLQAHPDPMENPAKTVRLANLAAMDNQAILHLLNNNPNGASIVHPDLQAPTATQVLLANQETPDLQVHLLKEADKAHLDLLDLLDLAALPVNQAAPANQVSPVNSPKFPAPKAHPDLQAHQASLVEMVNLAAPATLAVLANLVNLATLVHPAHLVPLETPVNLAPMESPADMVLAIIAHRLVLPLVIKRYTSTNQENIYNNNNFSILCLFGLTLLKNFEMRK